MLGIKYETWRLIHRLVYLAYILGLSHTYLLMGRTLLSPSLLGLLTGIYAILGLSSGFYIIFLYPRLAFKHRGYVKNLTQLNATTMELEVELDTPLDYQYGQFTFLKIYQEGFEKAAHPFTISGRDGKHIFFSIKNSGNHTAQIFKVLKVGSKVAVDRAYGHMILEEGRKNQVWVAGGIGITPFIAYLRQNSKLDKAVDFFTPTQAVRMQCIWNSCRIMLKPIL